MSGINWVNYFMGMAEYVSTKSKDPSTKVGAVIVNSDNIVVGMGYNGFPRGVKDKKEWLENREIKYEMIIHAEVNAVLNATQSLKGCHIYVTHPPCARCMAVLIQAGITSVMTKSPPEDMRQRFAKSYEICDMMSESSGIDVFEIIKEFDDGPVIRPTS